MKDYILLSAYTPNDLSAKVKEWIGKGFQPFGNHAVCHGNVMEQKHVNKPSEMIAGTLFTQAMIKD